MPATEHRAYVFDYDAFNAELRPVLGDALTTGDPAPLRAFIERHRGELKDPYAGEPLEPGWDALLETEDAQEYGEFALTRYYEPRRDIGAGAAWAAIQDLLVRESEAGTVLTPGHAVGPPTNPFDPGRMGSYFMPNADAQRRLQALDQLTSQKPHTRDVLQPLVRMYETITRSGKGAYQTF